MSWYWVILIIVCYVLLSAIACIILSRVAKNVESGMIVLIGTLWPLVVMLSPIIMFIILLYEIVDKCRYNEY